MNTMLIFEPYCSGFAKKDQLNTNLEITDFLGWLVGLVGGSHTSRGHEVVLNYSTISRVYMVTCYLP